MVFILITNLQSFIQQHVTDALAYLRERHHRYAFFWFNNSIVKNHNVLAAQISDDDRQVFYHIPNIVCKGVAIFDAMTTIIIEQLGPVIATAATQRIRLDDSPVSLPRSAY